LTVQILQKRVFFQNVPGICIAKQKLLIITHLNKTQRRRRLQIRAKVQAKISISNIFKVIVAKNTEQDYNQWENNMFQAIKEFFLIKTT
jgi:hypothetical protein